MKEEIELWQTRREKIIQNILFVVMVALLAVFLQIDLNDLVEAFKEGYNASQMN